MQLTGTEGNDTLEGSDLADSIAGRGGADTLRGAGGDDLLNGDTGDDYIYGDGGNDTIYGGAGTDSAWGGDGNDLIDGGDDNDNLGDSSGTNVLLGGGGNDRLISDGGSHSLLDGGDGDDEIVSEGGQADTLIGGAGNDVLTVYHSVSAPPLHITLDGGDGNDKLRFYSSSGMSINASGGSGIDTFVLDLYSTGIVITDFAAGVGGDILDLLGLKSEYGWHHHNPFGTAAFLRLVQSGADTLVQFDHDGAAGTEGQFETIITLKGVSASDLIGSNFRDGIYQGGTPPDSLLTGTSEADSLEGTEIPDSAQGLGGDDTIHGRAGNDTLIGGEGDDLLYGEFNDDSLVGGGGNDRLEDWYGNNTLEGGAGNDYLGSNGHCLLTGGDGDDMLFGSLSNSTLLGGAGNDILGLGYSYYPTGTGNVLRMDGGEGNDTFQTGDYSNANGIVIATGGIGADVFWIYPTSSYIVTDFAAGQGGDRIDVYELFKGVNELSNPFGAPASLRLVQRGADAVLQYDQDAAGTHSDFQDVLVMQNTVATSLTADNFVGGISPSGGASGAIWTGTQGDDSIGAGLFADTVSGAEGNDKIDGRQGNDSIDGGSGNDELRGGWGNDTLSGGDGADTLTGGEGRDTLLGGAGNDRLSDGTGGDRLDGGDGNDQLNTFMTSKGGNILIGGPGSDTLVGGSGMDTALFAGSFSSYVVTGTGSGKDAQRTVALVSGEGTDQLRGIDRLVFDDRAIALDVAGVAGKVYRLYQAAFDRTPDLAGVGFWIGMGDLGVGLNDIAAAFMTSPEFHSLYGAATSNEALVRLFYQNTLHRAPDEAGVAFWTEVLDMGRATAAEVLAGFSESAENTATVALVIGNGFDYQPYG